MNHEERFSIAMSMIVDGFNDDEISDVFSGMEQYNEKITRFQLIALRKQRIDQVILEDQIVR